MGLIYHAVQFPKAITSAFILTIFNHSRYLFICLLTSIGLYKPPPEGEEQDEAANSRDNYILLLDGSSPSFIPVPVYVVTAAIKARIPVVELQDFAAQKLERGEDDDQIKEEEEEEDEEKICCSICFEGIEWDAEIRNLCNCRHLFHRECLDNWVNEGRITCPLCRAMLISSKDILSYKMKCKPDASFIPSSSFECSLLRSSSIVN